MCFLNLSSKPLSITRRETYDSTYPNWFWFRHESKVFSEFVVRSSFEHRYKHVLFYMPANDKNILYGTVDKDKTSFFGIYRNVS